MPMVRKRRFVQRGNKKGAFFANFKKGRAIGNYGWIERNADLSKNFVRNRPSELFHILESANFGSKSGDFEIVNLLKRLSATSIFRLIKINERIYLNLFRN